MKLRFVKFFTSRENEIEKKEGGGRGTNITCSTILIQAAASAIAPLRSRSPPPFIFPFSLLPPFSASKCPLRRTHLVSRHVPPSSCSSYPSSSCSASPFLLHKITEAEERTAVTQRGAQPAGPASRLRRPARRTLASSPNQVAAAPLRF